MAVGSAWQRAEFVSAQGSQERAGSANDTSGRAAPGPRKARVPSPPSRRLGESRAQIVVLEEGALTGALQTRPADLDQTAVVAQNRGETALQLSERAIHRLAMVQRSGAELVQVLIFLAPVLDEQTMAARRLLGSAVLAHANSARRPCELVFVGRREDRDLSRQLWTLVELLVTEPGSVNVSIRLRFDDQTARPAC